MMDIDWSKAPINACAFLSPKSHAEGAFYAQSLRWESSTGLLNGCKVDGSRFCLDADNWDICRENDKPVEWTGEGLPPVGTVCEFQHRNAPDGKWHPTTIHYSSHAFIVYVDSIHECEECWRIDDSCAIDFRPIRTAEQIAAEERQIAIESLGEWLSTNCSIPTPYLWEAAQKIYDAGYRKREQK